LNGDIGPLMFLYLTVGIGNNRGKPAFMIMKLASLH